MKIGRRLCGLMLALGMFGTLFTEVQAAVALPSGSNSEDIGAQIEAYVEEHEEITAGMSVSVFHGQETLYTGYFGYADKEQGIPLTEESVVEWGSATKLFVWVSVMQLWEQGKLDLEKDVREYLPESFQDIFTYDTPITMLHLMNHNAGFQEVYADLFIKEAKDILPLEEALLSHVPPQIFEPGTVAAYSNWGCALAGFVVEEVSGMSFADYVHENIFKPLGMEHSALAADLSDNPWVQEKRKELQCYMPDGTLIPDCFYYIGLYPAGMCTSTLLDFETFGKALLAEDTPLFAKEETRQVLFTPSAYSGNTKVPSNYHGFWVLPYGVEVIGHGGNTAGCSSYLALNLENEIGLVVMTNQSSEGNYNGEMLELVFGKYSTEEWFPKGREDWKGIFRPGRTIRKGPFKIISLTYMLGEPETEEYWITGNDGVEKVCYPYGDWVDVPVWEFVLEIGLVLLWLISLVFAAASLLVKLILWIIRLCRKKRGDVPFRRWSTLACISQMVLVLLMGFVAVKAFSYAPAYSYIGCIVGVIPIFLLMLGLAVYGMMKIRKAELSKVRKVYNWMMVGSLLAACANILYWNLFMWWLV